MKKKYRKVGLGLGRVCSFKKIGGVKTEADNWGLVQRS